MTFEHRQDMICAGEQGCSVYFRLDDASFQNRWSRMTKTDDRARHSGLHDHGPDYECDHAETRLREAPGALKRAEAVCRASKARLTPIRRRVLLALLATHRPLGAYDIAEALREDGEALPVITIYRTLDFLIDLGLVHRLTSRNAFVACPHGHAPTDLVAFLICERCGGVDELSSGALVDTISGLMKKAQFTPQRQVLEIQGLCSHCREAAA